MTDYEAISVPKHTQDARKSTQLALWAPRGGGLKKRNQECVSHW